MRRPFLVLLLLLWPILGQAQDEQPEPSTVWSRPAEAAQAAHLDAAALPAIDRPFVFYVWNPTRSNDTAAAVSYAVNLACSRSRIIQQPVPVAGGLLLRWDNRTLDPEGTHLHALLERLVIEPHFHTHHEELVKVAPYQQGGKTWTYRRDVTHEFALHAGVNDLLSLSTFTGSKAPIIEAHYLLAKLLSTLDGGLYYDARGIEKTPKEGTSRDAFLKSLGADPNIERTDARNKIAVFLSGVTGKPRAVLLFYGSGVRPTDSVPIVTFTEDIADGDIDPAQHPIYSLLAAKFKASEVIGFCPNGLPAYALFNAQGERQDSVPDNIARDSTVPVPFTARLQPAISCIRCHGDAASEGWKPLANDVATLLASGLRPLDDSGQSDPVTALDRILGLYTGSPDEPLRTLRNGHEGLAYLATGGLWGEKSATSVAGAVSKVFSEYEYTKLGPAEVLAELGYAPDEGEAPQAAFNRLIPKLPALPETGQVPAEDVAIAGLRAGLSILRFNFERIYGDLSIRAQAGEHPTSDTSGDGP